MAKITLFDKQDVSFTYNDALGVYVGYQIPAMFALAEGETYNVEWGEVVCDREGVAFTNPYDGTACVGIGNPLVYGGEDNDDKFVIAYDTENNYMYFFSLEQASTHRVGVYQEDTEYKIFGSTLKAIANSIRFKTGSKDKMSPTAMAAAIDNISGGGGSAEGCVTMTFMNGDTVKFTRPVYIGDDCPDPILQGHIAEDDVKKDSTVDKVFTRNGWSLTDGGSKDDNALKNVTADRTVWAAFSSTPREYTITFYDEDGTTVLNTKQVPYGTVPSYTPSKDGAAFSGWTPTPVAVTGDASYTASFVTADVIIDTISITPGNTNNWGKNLKGTTEAGYVSTSYGAKYIIELDGVSYSDTVDIYNITHTGTAQKNDQPILGNPYLWLSGTNNSVPTKVYNTKTYKDEYNKGTPPFCIYLYKYSTSCELSVWFTDKNTHTFKLMRAY